MEGREAWEVWNLCKLWKILEEYIWEALSYAKVWKVGVYGCREVGR